METILQIVFLVNILCFGFANCKNYSVVDFGAKGDGESDDSEAFIKAWESMCGEEGDTRKMVIPSGQSFLLQPLQFQGPCGSSPIFQIDGEIVGPKEASSWKNLDQNSQKWITLSNINDLTVVGSGTINGFGKSFWEQDRANRPTALDFNSCNNLTISGITSRDSPRNHISIHNCKNVMVSNIKLFAPETSPNTDGIDISNSDNVIISKSTIGTGDDCIALNSGSMNINITEILCGPGHGISIGSLGAGGEIAKVENVQVTHCTFNKTTNGARIKTWQGGEGYARDIYFEHITIIDVKNPIIINQQYDDKKHSKRFPKRRYSKFNKDSEDVAISNVAFTDFNGTTPNVNVATLTCSNIEPCRNITISGINISPPDGGEPKINCTNVVGIPECTKN